MESWFFFFSSAQAEGLGLTLLPSLWQGALIVGLIATWQRFTPRVAANKRYAIALTGVLSLVGSMMATWFLVQPETNA